MAGLDALTNGRVLIGDVDFTTLNDKHLTLLPREKPGFIFQAYGLVPTLTAQGDITQASSGPGRWWPRPLERGVQRERGVRSAPWWMVQSSPHPAGPTSRRIP